MELRSDDRPSRPGMMVSSNPVGAGLGGSSGSAAFVTFGERRYVVGQLLGGTASCAARDGVDHYGRFDTSYRTALRRWLNPTAAN